MPPLLVKPLQDYHHKKASSTKMDSRKIAISSPVFRHGDPGSIEMLPLIKTLVVEE